MITLDYKPESQKRNSGTLENGQAVAFGFTTDGSVHEKGEGNRLQITSPVGYNGHVIVSLGGLTVGMDGSQPSGHIAFGDGQYKMALAPNMHYEGTVQAIGMRVGSGVDLQLYVKGPHKTDKKGKTQAPPASTVSSGSAEDKATVKAEADAEQRSQDSK